MRQRAPTRGRRSATSGGRNFGDRGEAAPDVLAHRGLEIGRAEMDVDRVRRAHEPAIAGSGTHRVPDPGIALAAAARPRSRPPRSRPRGGRSSRGGAGVFSATSTSSCGRTSFSPSIFATRVRPIRPRSLSTSTTTTRTLVAAVEHLRGGLEPVALRQDAAHVQQAVDALAELDERAEVGDLDDLAGVLVTDLDLLGHRLDRLPRPARRARRSCRRCGSSRLPRCRSAPRSRPRASGWSRRPCR